jgi:hypothetical protein
MLLAPVGAVRIRRAKQAAQKQKTSNKKGEQINLLALAFTQRLMPLVLGCYLPEFVALPVVCALAFGMLK